MSAVPPKMTQFVSYVTALFFIVLGIQRGARGDQCDSFSLGNCYKSYFSGMLLNITDLTQGKDADLDDAIYKVSRTFPAVTSCRSLRDLCSDSNVRDFYRRLEYTYETWQTAMGNQDSLKDIVFTYKCFDVDHFKSCFPRMVRDFFGPPPENTTLLIQELCRKLELSSTRCLEDLGNCPERKPGATTLKQLRTSFRDIWGCNDGSAATMLKVDLGYFVLLLTFVMLLLDRAGHLCAAFAANHKHS